MTLPEPRVTKLGRTKCTRCNEPKVNVPYGSPLCSNCIDLELDEAFLREERTDISPTQAGNGAENRGRRSDMERFPALPAKALASAVERRVEVVRAQRLREEFTFSSSRGTEVLDSSREDVCVQLGITSKTVRDWQSGRIKRVAFDTADMIMQRAGWLWWEVWGEIKPPAARGRPWEVLHWMDEVEADYVFVQAVFEAEKTTWRIYEQEAA
jgi:hypothetical protein